MDTRKLWRTWRARRRSADFDRLARPEIPYARDLARRMGATQAEADDIVQESLLQLARERSDDPVRVGLRAWIGRRVVLRYRMHVRASSRRRRHEGAAAQAAREGRAAEPSARVDLRDEVEAALDHLDGAQRQTVVMRYLYDLDYRDIAYILGISENACRIRVHKALHRLRRLLGGKAPALIAAIALPIHAADAALAKGAAAAATGMTIKVAAASALAAAAVTTAVVVLPAGKDEPRKETAPPVAVAPPAVEPPPQPTPPPPPPAPAAPTGLDLLAKHRTGEEDLTERFWVWERVAEPVLEGPVVEFGPGTHDVTYRILPGDERKTLTLRGAGMDKTVLRGRWLVLAEGRIEHLRVSDLTFQGDHVLDVRGAASALFERVRLRGFTTTAGHGAPVGVSGSAYLGFRECEFVGGYKRPAGGQAISVRGEALALFDHCRFFDLDGAVIGGAKSASDTRVQFVMCTFARTPISDRSLEFPAGVRSSVFRTVGGWGSEHVATSNLIVTRRPRVRCRVRDLRAVIDAFPVHDGERVAGVELMAWEGLELPYFVVHVAGRRPRSVLVDALGKPVEDPDGEFTLHRFPPRSGRYEGRPLKEAIRDLPPGRPARGFVEECRVRGDGTYEPWPKLIE